VGREINNNNVGSRATNNAMDQSSTNWQGKTFSGKRTRRTQKNSTKEKESAPNIRTPLRKKMEESTTSLSLRRVVEWGEEPFLPRLLKVAHGKAT